MERSVILNHLIDKYESSKHLIEPGSSNRRVMIRTDKKKSEFPEYDFETAAVRDAFNSAADTLEREGLISVEWLPGRKVILKISLNFDKISESYEFLGRKHPKEKVKDVISILDSELTHVTPPWIASWRNNVVAAAQNEYRVPNYCKGDLSFFQGLTKSLDIYSRLDGEPITMRSFSIRCFHDSKRFEREFQEEFLRIARLYNSELSDACVENNLGIKEQLAYLGIYARPELYELSGKCSIITDTSVLQLDTLYPQGIALPSTITDRICGIELGTVHKVVFIENKTNYDEYLTSEICSDELVIYHGGFLSPQKRRFLKNLLYAISDKTPMFFWADIDLGGFQMFMSLQQLFPKLMPMRMAADDVIKYHDYGLNRPEEYLIHLDDLMHSERYVIFRDTVREILKYKVTIEQEVFLLDSLAHSNLVE